MLNKALNKALAPLSAILLVLAFPRWSYSLLAAVALAPLLVAVARETRPAVRFILGWVAGVIYWFGVCYWIQFVLSVHGGMGETAGWAVFMLFCAIKALHMGVFALGAGILMGRWWAVPSIAALWVALEATHGFLGFAWLALGNAAIAMSVPLRLAPYTGVYGISFAFAMMSTALALAALQRPRIQLAWVFPLLFLGLLPRVPDAQRARVGAALLQPDVSETEDWTRESVDKLQRRLAEMSEQAAGDSASAAPARIVVWPEVPAPLYYEADPHFRETVDDLARSAGIWVLAGAVAHDPTGAPLNSAVLVAPTGTLVSRYDKVNLVPFGEFVPWPLGALTRKISTEAGDFAPGHRPVVSPVDGHKIGTFICYESVFPNFVRRFAAEGAEVLFNISNDGWFGASGAREQHLTIVRMRAVENRRWILRATNDGITAAIDPAGRVRGRLPLHGAASLRTGFNYIPDQTFYTRHGDWFPLLCALAAALLLTRGQTGRSPARR